MRSLKEELEGLESITTRDHKRFVELEGVEQIITKLLEFQKIESFVKGYEAGNDKQVDWEYLSGDEQLELLAKMDK